MVPEESTPESTPASPDKAPVIAINSTPLFQKDIPTTSPREGTHAKCPGDYRLAYRAAQAEVDPGEELRIELYITGYGEISGAKLTFYPPTYFIEQEKSRVMHGLTEVGGTRTRPHLGPTRTIDCRYWLHVDVGWHQTS
jgi:hypothetical protein